MERNTGTLDALLADLDERGMTLSDLVEEVATATAEVVNEQEAEGKTASD